MSLRSEDFESSASAVSPPRHIWEVEARSSFYFPRSREAMRRKREEFCQTRRASDKPPRYKSRHARRAAIAPLTTATPTHPNSRGVSNAAAERTKRRLIFREEREQLLDQIVGTLLNDPNGRSARSRRRAAVPQFQRFRARHQPYDLPPLLSVFAAINRVWVIAMRLSG